MDEDFERDENNNYEDEDDDTEYESDENSEAEEENVDPAVVHETSLSCLDGENVELIGCEVAVMSGDNVENLAGPADTDDMEDYKLYEGLSGLFQSEEEEADFSHLTLTSNDLIDFEPEESVEDYIENFLESLILNIFSLKELSGSDYQDDIDDEFYSCDSPIEDENDRT